MAVDLKNLIDINLLSYFKSKLDLLFANKVDKETGKGLSSNDYTSAEKTKLANIEAQAQVNKLEGIQVAGETISATNKIVNIPTATQSSAGAMSAADKTKLDGVATGAQVNVIETVKVNGTSQTVTGKAVDISVPTTVAELTDADDYATKDYVDENGGKIDKIKVNGTEQTIDSSDKSVNIAVPTGGSAAPAMDGTAAAGTAATWAHSDHVHPHDTSKVDKEDGKGLSTNDYTTNEKNKLSGIASGAQVNVLESVKVNGTALSITGKAVNVTVPTKVSDIDNDSGFITIADVPEGAAGTTTTPKMDGTAAVGTETAFARGDHVHPHDSTKVDVVDGMGLSHNDYTDTEKSKLSGIAAGAQVNVVTNASSTGSGAAQTMTVSKGSTNYTTYTKDALDTSLGLKADASSVYTKTEIDQKLVGAMNYKGTKATTSALPSSGNAKGDVWHVTADGSEWAWNGEAWEELGSAVDLSGYVEEDDLGLATNEDIDALFA